MSTRAAPDPEPRTKAELVPFTEGDFHALAPSLARIGAGSVSGMEVLRRPLPTSSAVR